MVQLIEVTFHNVIPEDDRDMIYENGVWSEMETTPYIFVGDPEENIANLINPDEIVIPMRRISIKYGCGDENNLWRLDSDTQYGFTREYLARSMVEIYRHIYCLTSYEDKHKLCYLSGIVKREMFAPFGQYGPNNPFCGGLDYIAVHTLTQVKDNIFEMQYDT